MVVLTLIITWSLRQRSFIAIFSHLELVLHYLQTFKSSEKLEAEKFKEQQQEQQGQQQQQEQQQQQSNS